MVGGEKCLRLINNHNHPILTMLSLRTIQPQWRRIIHLDRERRKHALLDARSSRHEARVEPRSVAVRGGRLARRVKGRLRDCVVAGVELELDVLAGLRGDLLGRVGQAAVSGDRDDPGFLGGGEARGGERAEEEGGELHFFEGGSWVSLWKKRIRLVERNDWYPKATGAVCGK